jgi:hypothetical protein
MNPNGYTAEEISAAYKQARLRYAGITLTRALQDPLIYKSLCLQASAMRQHQQQQHGHPAPMQRAA